MRKEIDKFLKMVLTVSMIMTIFNPAIASAIPEIVDEQIEMEVVVDPEVEKNNEDIISEGVEELVDNDEGSEEFTDNNENMKELASNDEDTEEFANYEYGQSELEIIDLTLDNWTYDMVVEDFDWGPGVTSLILDLAGDRLHSDAVLATDFAVSVYHSGFASGTALQQRPVTAAFVSDAAGNPVVGYGDFVTLSLSVHPENGNPFNFSFGTGGNMGNTWSNPYEHTITYLAVDFMPERTGRIMPITDDFDKDLQFVASDGVALQYAHYQPTPSSQSPLIVWLHGAGEGTFNGAAGSDVAILGTRFARLAAPEIQGHLGGAHILLPQASTRWLNSGLGPHVDGISHYETALIELIETVIKTNPSIDANRIYIGGVSNGGFMAVRVLLSRPDLFAGAIPVCLYFDPAHITDAEIAAIAHVPMWLVHDINDPTTPYAHSRSLYNRLVAAGAADVYFTVTDGIYDTSGSFLDDDGNPWRYNDHWSWIPVHNNEITRAITTANANGSTDAQITIFEWLAKQTLAEEVGTLEIIANVHDGGEAVDRVRITLADGTWDANSLTLEMFEVLATHTLPYSLPSGAVGLGQVTNQARTITGFETTADGRTLYLDLAILDLSGPLVDFLPGASTLAWTTGISRNLMMDLDYTVNLLIDIPLATGRLDAGAVFVQNDEIIRPEVDLFQVGRHAGLNYRYFVPENANSTTAGRPLIVWFHGMGEGGTAISQNNMTQLLANRGALGFMTAEAQDIFGGAYVLAPQAPSGWSGDEIIVNSMAMIEEFIANNHVDVNRIYISGASAGGAMVIRTVIANPDFFAAIIPICPVINEMETPDAALASIAHVPMWLIYAHECEDHAPISQRIHRILPDIVYTPFETVTVPGIGSFNGHWSWILLARNIPTYQNETVWEWTARQSLATSESQTPANPAPALPQTGITAMPLSAVGIMIITVGVTIVKMKRR